MALRWKGSRADLKRLLRSVAGACAGHGPEAEQVANAILTRGAVALLSQIQTAFIAKSRGGTGSDGIKWKPLSPATIARRRTSRAELKSLGLGGGHGTGKLSDTERKAWRKVYSKTLANLGLRGKTGPQAQSRARAAAWSAIKKAGGTTRADILAGRTVEILRDTSALFRSLTPGYEESPADPPGQVREVEPGKITVGTVEKPWHHAGVPGRLPARPLWPTDGTLPPEWWQAIGAALVRGMVKAITSAVKEGR